MAGRPRCRADGATAAAVLLLAAAACVGHSPLAAAAATATAQPSYHFTPSGTAAVLGAPAATVVDGGGTLHLYYQVASASASGAAHSLSAIHLPTAAPAWQWGHATTTNMATFMQAAAPALTGGSPAAGVVLASGGGGGSALVGGNGTHVDVAMSADLDTFARVGGAGFAAPGGYNGVFGPAAWTGPAGSVGITWAAAASTRASDGAAALLLFNSSDGRAYRFVQEMWHGGALPNGASPVGADFFPLDMDGKYAAIYSASEASGTMWAVGTGNETFAPAASGIVDAGDVLQGVRTWSAPDGRRLMLATLAEAPAADAATDAAAADGSGLRAWTGQGVLSLPREVVVSGNKLQFPPAQEVTLLRHAHQAQGPIYLPPNTTAYGLSGLETIGSAMELAVSVAFGAGFGAGGAGETVVGMRVLADGAAPASGSQYTAIEIVSEQPAQECTNGTMYNETDSLANDYQSWAMSTKDPNVCRDACCNDPKCTVYTYTNPQPFAAGDEAASSTSTTAAGAAEPAPTLRGTDPPCTSGATCCWLKSGAPTLKPKGGCPECTSGLGHSMLNLTLRVVRAASGSGASATITVPLGIVAAGKGVTSTDVRVFIDASVLEVFVDGGAAVVSTRVYPDAASTGVQLYTTGGADATVNVDAWQLTTTPHAQPQLS